MTDVYRQNYLHWMTTTLDIAQCDRVEIVMPMKNNEVVEGVLPQSWPAAVQSQIMHELYLWMQMHPDRLACAITFGLAESDSGNGGKKSCVVIVHHRHKEGAAA